MKTGSLSFHDRIRFALRNYFPTPDDVKKIGEEMKRETPDVMSLPPRPFGVKARLAMAKAWKLKK